MKLKLVESVKQGETTYHNVESSFSLGPKHNRSGSLHFLLSIKLTYLIFVDEHWFFLRNE